MDEHGRFCAHHYELLLIYDTEDSRGRYEEKEFLISHLSIDFKSTIDAANKCKAAHDTDGTTK